MVLEKMREIIARAPQILDRNDNILQQRIRPAWSGSRNGRIQIISRCPQEIPFFSIRRHLVGHRQGHGFKVRERSRIPVVQLVVAVPGELHQQRSVILNVNFTN